jgi:hypothetical protein
MTQVYTQELYNALAQALQPVSFHTLPTYIAYKLFEEKDGMPRSLVHGMPTEDGRRSRMFPLDEWINSETGKPGFNCFDNPAALLQYYPRFRVRASRLVACQVYVKAPYTPHIRDSYQRYRSMFIYEDDWNNRIVPYALDINPKYQDLFMTWVEEYITKYE